MNGIVTLINVLVALILTCAYLLVFVLLIAVLDRIERKRKNGGNGKCQK